MSVTMKQEPFKWVKSHIERVSYKWPPRSEASKLDRRPSQLKDKRVKWEYKCRYCNEWFKEKETQLDHIIPKGKYSKETFFVWLDRLLCKTGGFQRLCIPCHKKKSATEHKDGSYK